MWVLSAGIAQLVEHNLAKVGVASSSLVSRSSFLFIIWAESLDLPVAALSRAVTVSQPGKPLHNGATVAEYRQIQPRPKL